jgi:translation initiation factor IF-3
LLVDRSVGPLRITHTDLIGAQVESIPPEHRPPSWGNRSRVPVRGEVAHATAPNGSHARTMDRLAPTCDQGGGLPRVWRSTDEHEEHHISEPRINERIRVPEVRLVGPNGEQVGIVRVEDALRLAQESDLDLVEVAPEARPPVCKLMDFGKFKYEADMKAREARRNQANTVLKEIRFRLKIDPHDYGTKKGHVERFLKAGDKVKVMIMFRGREQSRPEMGLRLLRRLSDDVVDIGFIESAPKQDGRNMIMVLGPVKKKADAKSEQRRRAQETVTTKSPTAAPAAAQATDAPVSAEVEAPQVEAPQVEAPAAVEPTVVEAPAVEAPAVEAPVVEPPVVEPPVVEPPVAAAPPAAAAATAPARTAVPKPVAARPAAAKPAAAASSAARRTTVKPTPAKTAADDAPETASAVKATPAAKAAPKPRATKASPAKDA